MDKVVLYATGDVLINREDPESIFALVKPTLDKSDIRFCQLEETYLNEGEGAPNPTQRGAIRAHRASPKNAVALKFAGFDVISMAGNQCLKWGFEGLFKTMELVKQNGAMVIGVGKNIEEARRPGIIERKGIKVGFLAYNSILPTNYWATEDRPGCAPLRAFTVYEPFEYDQPGQSAIVHTFCRRDDLLAMEADIKKLRGQVDVVVVSLHYGLHFTRALLADYQRGASHAAIDAGADVVLGGHAHILKGIEVYKGKVIFYSLGNFAIDSPLKDWPNISPDLKALTERYNWKIEPDWVKYPFPPESRNALLTKCLLSKKGIEQVSFLPAKVNKQAQTEVVGRADKRSAEVLDYVKAISQEQGLKASFTWAGDEIVIS